MKTATTNTNKFRIGDSYQYIKDYQYTFTIFGISDNSKKLDIVIQSEAEPILYSVSVKELISSIKNESLVKIDLGSSNLKENVWNL